MNEYTVRSTYTRADSAARRAADIAVILMLCMLLVFVLFRFVLVPAAVTDPAVSGLSDGDVVLVDRVSGFIADYSAGDIVRVKLGGEYVFYRVAALGGQSYLVRNGKAYIDGELIDESAYGGSWPQGTELSADVPEDSLLLLPDVRGDIEELSPFTVPYSSVWGEVRFRVSPLRRIAFFF